MTAGKGRCPQCRRHITLTTFGRIWAHDWPFGTRCKGSGHPPLRELAAELLDERHGDGSRP